MAGTAKHQSNTLHPVNLFGLSPLSLDPKALGSASPTILLFFSPSHFLFSFLTAGSCHGCHHGARARRQGFFFHSFFWRWRVSPRDPISIRPLLSWSCGSVRSVAANSKDQSLTQVKGPFLLRWSQYSSRLTHECIIVSPFHYVFHYTPTVQTAEDHPAHKNQAESLPLPKYSLWAEML